MVGLGTRVANRLLELKDTLREFVDQNDHPALCIDARDDDLLYIHKMLQAVDRELTGDVVLAFADPCDEAVAWVDAVLVKLDEQLAATALAPLPSECQDARLRPGARLRAAVDHLTTLLPDGDHRCVWGLLPLRVGDPQGYMQAVSELLPITGLAGWMQRHRVILRDDHVRPFMIPALQAQAVTDVLIYAIDLSTEAFTSDLVEDASNPEVPEAQRMQAIMQLAALDFAHRRPAQAIEKYGVLYAYHEREQQPDMQAMCLGGVAEVLQREGQVAEAKARYQQALALAVPAGNVPVMLNMLIGAGDCSLQLEHWQDAEGYFDLANQVAGKAVNPFAKCDCLEKLGVARAGQQNFAGAIEAWNVALGLTEQVAYFPRRRSVLERLVAVYASANMSKEQRICEAELERVRVLEREAGQA